MEKRIWTAPKAVVEEFMPNEYIAACWYIVCDGKIGSAHTTCQYPDYYIYTREDGVITKVEYRTWGVEIFDETISFYTDDQRTEFIKTGDIEPGMTVYWATFRDNFYHSGTVRDANPNSPDNYNWS